MAMDPQSTGVSSLTSLAGSNSIEKRIETGELQSIYRFPSLIAYLLYANTLLLFNDSTTKVIEAWHISKGLLELHGIIYDFNSTTCFIFVLRLYISVNHVPLPK